jgi:hypothetical protein
MRKVLDERGKYLASTYGTRMRIKTIPFRKPARIDNVEEVESDNAPRKKLLAARTSGRGDPKNRAGNAANLGNEDD